MYNQGVLDRFNNPKNAGSLAGANGVGKVGNMQCGDIMKIYVQIERDIIRDAKFKTFGCVAAIASSDMVCDVIKGKTIDQALAISNSEIVTLLGGLPPQKVHCSVLAREAVEAAVADYKKRLEREKKKV
ncbi:MAG: iron-sulfur cluster assembly scaffold protein [Firmicutes bacterium]|nr:iron-sulfur cluster assembly scaffold protein [Bacillota bacterium]